MQSMIEPDARFADNLVLQACLPQTRQAIFAGGEVRYFTSGMVLFSEDDPAGVVLFHLDGSLQMGKSTARARRQVVCTMTNTSCSLCLLNLGERALTDVRALEEGRVLLLGRDHLVELTKDDAAFRDAAWGSATNCMEHLSNLVEHLSFHKVAERVAMALLETTEADGDLVRLTQAELAAEVGTTREVVARCLAGLQTEGLVRLGRGRITVLKRAGLVNDAAVIE